MKERLAKVRLDLYWDAGMVDASTVSVDGACWVVLARKDERGACRGVGWAEMLGLLPSLILLHVLVCLIFFSVVLY